MFNLVSKPGEDLVSEEVPTLFTSCLCLLNGRCASAASVATASCQLWVFVVV